MAEEPSKNKYLTSFFDALGRTLDYPATFFREKIVVPNQERNKFPYYHRRFRRVPEIDECYTDDDVCFVEADLQFQRDRLVEQEIVNILRQRRVECDLWYGPDAPVKCKKILDDYLAHSTNWFIKYGELGATANVLTAYMKQKHRLIWERRYGKLYGPEYDAKWAERPKSYLKLDKNV